jgi:hypothetical protein
MRYLLTLVTTVSLLLVSAVVFAQTDAANSKAETATRIVSLKQARQALQLARLAADNDLTDLSLKAVREAFSGGPPLNPLNISSASGTGISTATLTIGSSNTQEHDQTIAEVYQAISNLVQLWQEKQVDADGIYETLREVVFPSGRPKEIFLYAPPLKGNIQKLPETHHLGRLLIDYAAQADRLKDLEQHIDRRKGFPRARVPGHVISCELVLLNSDEDGIRTLLDSLPAVIQGAHDSSERELLNHFVLRVISMPKVREAAIPLFEQIIDQYPPSTNTENGRLEPISSLLISAAKLRSEQGDVEKTHEHIERFLAVNEANNSRYDGDHAFQLARGQLEQAAIVFLEGNMIEDAVEKFREAAALSVGAARSIAPQGHFLFARIMKLLQETPADKRFEIVHDMVIPDSGSGSVVLTVRTITDLTTHPMFQEVLPEAQRGTRIDLQGYGPSGLLLSSGSMLVETAAELNRLDELMKEIKPLYEADNVNARILWGLCLIERKDEQIVPLLDKLTTTYKEAAAENVRFTDQDIWKDVLLTCGALKVPAATQANLNLINALTAYCQKIQRMPILTRLRVLQADAISRLWKGAAPRPFAYAKPAMWDTVCEVTALEHLQGGGRSYWFTHQGHVQHLGGGHESGLYFQYPLTGTFTIEAQVYDSGWAESEVAYGGVVHKFQAWSNSGEIYANGRYGRFNRHNLFRNRPDHGIFLRHSLEVTPESTVHRVNGHPVHTDPYSRHSPWVGFRAAPHCKTVVKRVKILGEPVIPREVRLSDSPLMRGWLTGFYGESRPPALYANSDLADETILNQAAGTNWDWRWESGEIIGKKIDSQQQISGATESRIYYERPMFSGERIDWEFFYKPSAELVHPALGRMAFLLRPDDGVKLHWMTDGPQDPAGLPTDHELDDPDGRRGPDRLPLQTGWNQMQLALEDDQVRLTLNGVSIYERIFENLEDRGFSFFHFKDRTTARVRNVVLSGDWPEKLTSEIRDAILAAPSIDPNPLNRYTLATTIGRQPLYYDTIDRYLESLGLPDQERYEFLKAWVIPEPVQPSWRVEGAFTPTMVPPPLQEKFARITHLSPAQQQLNPRIGGILVSPAVELVATARRLGRLPELRQRIESQWANPAAPVSTRSKAVLLLLCDLAEENYEAVNQSLLELEQTLLEVKAKQHYERWPSVVAASQAMLYDETRTRAMWLLKRIVIEQNRKEQGDNWTWNQRVIALLGLAKYLTWTEGDASAYGNPPALTQWVSTVHSHGDQLEFGIPWSHWIRADNAAHHLVGNARDCLYYQSPLLGNFSVEAHLTSLGWRDTILQYGDRWINLTNQAGRFNHGSGVKNTGTVTPSPPLENVVPGYDLKLEVQENRGAVFINSRKIHAFEYDPVRDPWLGVWSRNWNQGFVRDLKISGNPEIPDELRLSGNPTLAGWVASYFRQPMAGNSPDWFKRGDEIVGRLRVNRKDLFEESLLQYHRPFTEEAELSYEFRYDPQAQEVHPAVGRLVFLLKPDGVYTHWLTNGRFNQHGLNADAGQNETDAQKHQGRLPLKAGENNTMKVVLKGDRVQLVLNEELVFERALNQYNSRLFGFFHYKGQSEASVRNVSLKGNWPQQLPALENQEFANSEMVARDSYVARFADRFEIDFRKEKPTAERFRIPKPNFVQSIPEGLKFTSPGKNRWSNVQMHARCRLRGDFDVSLSFENLDMDNPGEKLNAIAGLFVSLPGPKEGIRTGFQLSGDRERTLLSTYVYGNLSDKQVRRSSRENLPGTAGTYRIVREGNVVSCLFAPEGDDRFRKLFTHVVHDQDIPPGGLRILAVAGKEGTEASFTVTSLRIAADKIIWPE